MSLMLASKKASSQASMVWWNTSSALMCSLNAKTHKASLASTFIDLRNAFGSVSHNLLLDMLSLVKVPPQICSYIKDMYSKLSTTFVTKKWSTPAIAVKRGLFQGDTLSPFLFLPSFNQVCKLPPLFGLQAEHRDPKLSWSPTNWSLPLCGVVWPWL